MYCLWRCVSMVWATCTKHRHGYCGTSRGELTFLQWYSKSKHSTGTYAGDEFSSHLGGTLQANRTITPSNSLCSLTLARPSLLVASSMRQGKVTSPRQGIPGLGLREVPSRLVDCTLSTAPSNFTAMTCTTSSTLRDSLSCLGRLCMTSSIPLFPQESPLLNPGVLQITGASSLRIPGHQCHVCLFRGAPPLSHLSGPLWSHSFCSLSCLPKMLLCNLLRETTSLPSRTRIVGPNLNTTTTYNCCCLLLTLLSFSLLTD